MLTMWHRATTTQSDACSFSVASRGGYKFTGKERDAESGLDNFGARYYGSSVGRFMTPDWAATPIDVPPVAHSRRFLLEWGSLQRKHH
jgi:RHS repeat-associated protein